MAMRAFGRPSWLLLSIALVVYPLLPACDRAKSTGSASLTAGDSGDSSTDPVQLVASSATETPTNQTTAPPTASRPPETTVGAKFQRLARIAPKWLPRQELALRMALDLCLCAARADGKRAAGLLEPVGYQTLPLEGDLPEKPDKPTPAAAFQAKIEKLRTHAIEQTPLEIFAVVDRETLRKTFPAAAEWMLPEDYAILIQPSAAAGGDWLARPCCVLVRIRAQRATVLGGNLLEALRTP